MSNARRSLRAILLSLTALSLSATAIHAEPAPPFQTLLGQALSTSPRLAEARAEIARAEGLKVQAGVRPNPVLGVEIENIAGSGPYDGADLAETTASIAQPLELGGKRSARVAAAQAEVTAAQARARRLQAQFAFELATAYAGAETAERRLTLAREQLGFAEEDARAAAAFVQAGREPELRRLQADAAVQTARAMVREAEAERTTAFVDLKALVGGEAEITSIPASLLDQQGPLFPGEPVVAAGAPIVLAAQAELEAAERRVRVEQTRAVPDVTVSLGLRRFEESNATAFLGGLSVPLPLFDRNRGAVSAARADANIAQARLSAARLEADAAGRSSSAKLSAADSRLAAAKAGERAAEEAYRLTRLGFEGGKLGLIELLTARRALADARNQTINAALDRVTAQAAQARLNGAAFGEGQ